MKEMSRFSLRARGRMRREAFWPAGSESRRE